MTALGCARMFDGTSWHHDRTVILEGERIAAVTEARADATALPPDWTLVPGFIDLQVNGGGGVLFNHATDAACLAVIAAAHAYRGTTAILPTLVSDRARYEAALDAVAQAIADGVAGVVGLHLEGPFLNPARRGIHPAAKLGPPNEADLALLCRLRPWPVLATLAPEILPPGLLARIATSGPRVFIGHSDAGFEQAQAALGPDTGGGLGPGAIGFTHLFNAMSQFGSRAPGCVGAAFAHDAALAGIICDGLHVHPASVHLAWRLLGADRLFLVSDAMPTTASDQTEFVWDGQAITLADGRLALPDGTLAGAHLTMAEAVANAVRLCGIPLQDALRMATATPARAVGLSALGHIAPGMRADLVALDPALAVVAVWQAGRRLR